MKIKLNDNTVHNGKVLKKDAIVDLPDKEAEALIKGGHAEKSAAEKPADKK